MKKFLVLIIMSINMILCACGSAEEINKNVIIPEGTELVGELVTPLNSKKSKIGDPIIFKIEQNFLVNNAVIISKGTSGRATVTRASKATYFGQGGQVGFTPNSILTNNGVEVPLSFETKRRGSAVNDANMVVATIGLGVFASFFHGKNQVIPAGSKFIMYVAEDVDLGIKEEDLPKYFYVFQGK